jgi:hypothetical protein
MTPTRGDANGSRAAIPPSSRQPITLATNVGHGQRGESIELVARVARAQRQAAPAIPPIATAPAEAWVRDHTTAER